MTAFENARRNARHVLMPPQLLQLSQWAEENVCLPSSMAVPGKLGVQYHVALLTRSVTQR